MAHSDRMFFLLNFELGERRVQKKFSTSRYELTEDSSNTDAPEVKSPEYPISTRDIPQSFVARWKKLRRGK